MVMSADIKFMKAQTKEHSILSEDGHEWQVSSHGQTRQCTKCLALQCSPPVWTGFPASTSITKEDILFLTR
jgi:hypothetical protein